MNDNDDDVIDLPSLQQVTFGGVQSFCRCHHAQFESME